MDRVESLMDDMEDISDERASYPLGSAKRCQLEMLHMRKRIRYIQAMIRASECSSAPQQGGWKEPASTTTLFLLCPNLERIRSELSD